MMNLREAAAAVAGELRGIDRCFVGVSTDTRALSPGDLFVALKGERFDAASFVPTAVAAGAAGALVTRDAATDLPAAGSFILVEDARAALGRLAAFWRGRFTLPLIGLTGSNGKTTVKDMIAAVLREHCADSAAVLATEGNLNNDIGVPLTLLRLRAHHRYAVVEMGMNHAGEIRHLAALARPDVALVNNAGTAHIGLLGSREAIAGAKGEIYEGLPAHGVALINADDDHAPMWRAANVGRRVVEFGLTPAAAVTGRYTGHALHSEIVVATPAGDASFELPLPGLHNVRNALAAAAAAHVLGVPPATIARALGAFHGPKGRMQRHAGVAGCTLLDDTYNANPDSTLAAIAVLAGLPGRRIVVLGDMGELGDQGGEQHRLMGERARLAGIDGLFTLGELSALAAEAFGEGASHFTALEPLLAAIRPLLGPETTLLVKGSRFMRMERVVQAFKAGRA